ncbi:MAG: hypothetical protein EXR98_22230 [Gemmataceae bacterium]|nr:hypothetical protein [Gemmataceae bacterium]
MLAPRNLVHLAGLLALFALPCLARADDTETREFSVFVDGKEAGMSRMTILQKDDGTTYVAAAVEVKFRHLILDYSLKLETQEWWKAGRLVGMKTTGNDNGKKVDVTLAADNNALRLRVNGKESQVRPDVWITSYWKLADARFHNKQVPILESDTGKEYNCELKFVATEKVPVGTQLQECFHFRVAAAPGPVDLWYDRYHRLVRAEFTESGHKTIIQLVNVKR